MTPRRIHRWKSPWMALLLLILALGLVPYAYLTVRENQCRREGNEVVAWIHGERSRTGRLPAELGLTTRFRWQYQVDGHDYFLSAYYGGITRLTLDYSSKADAWRINRDH